MKGIFSPVDDVREPPVPATGEDVREPPLPSNNGSKEELPSEEEKIDPDDGGGRAPRRLKAGDEVDPDRTFPNQIPENKTTGREPLP